MKEKLVKLLPLCAIIASSGALSAQSQANVPFGEGGTIQGAGVDKATSGTLTAENGNMFSLANVVDVRGLEYFTYSNLASGGTLPATIQAGTYALTLRVGDIGSSTFVGLNDLSASTNTDQGAVAGFFSTLGSNGDAFLAAEESKNNMYSEFNAITGVTYAPPVEADPSDGEWTTWTFRWTVASGSALIGTDPYFGAYAKMAVLAGGSNAVFDDSTLYFAAEGVNEAPIADDQTVKVFEDTALAITLTGFDVEGSSLSFSEDDTGTLGTVTGTAPNLTYTPPAAYTGPDSFTFTVNDGTDDSAVATVTINVEANVAPVADAQSVSTIEETPLAITLTGSDSDGGPSALTFSVDDGSTLGTVTGTAPDLTYTPPAAYTGLDSFTFTVNDGIDDSVSATITIDVVANVVPVADAQSVSTIEETPLAITLTGSDSDGGPSALTFSVDDGSTLGTVTGTAPDLTYTPPAAYTGSDSFTFTVNDGLDDSASATITIDVVANVVPVADAQTVAALVDTPLAIILTGSDPDGGPSALTFSVDDGSTLGTVTGVAPNVTYTPPAAYVGSDSFTFTVNDGLDTSAPATVNVTVSGGTPGTIEYTFETPGNISGTGVDIVYVAPDVNTLGSGITIGEFTLEDRDAGQFSRFVDIGGGSVEAALGNGGTPLKASFTITIDDTVSVDLTQIAFDASLRWNTNNSANVTEEFSVTVGGGTATNVTNSAWTKSGNPNYANNPANTQTVTLSGLTGLTNTTVTFEWLLGSSRNNNFAVLSSGLDDIILSGAVTQVPSIGQATILIVSGGDDVELSWMSVDGSSYTVEGTDDLTAETWDPVETGILGDGELITKTYDITEVGDQYFFRITLEP